MNLDNNVKRRATAAKNRSIKDETDMTGIPNRQLYFSRVSQAEPGHLKRRRRRTECVVVKGKQNRIHQRLYIDREMILFLLLAALGAASVVVVCFFFSMIFEDGNKSRSIFRWVVERLVFLVKKLRKQEARKGCNAAPPTINMADYQSTEFQQTMPTSFDQFIEGTLLDQQRLDETIIEEVDSRDFGGLDLSFRQSGNMGKSRQIRHDETEMFSDFRDYRTADRDDDQDIYYAYDDDFVRNPFIESYKEDEAIEIDGYCCRRISEHRLYFPNCNSFHETPLLESEATYIGSGTYRQAMKINISYAKETETVVVKDIHLWHDLAYDAYEFTRMDAIVAERLTASSRIYAIYGTCGIGIMSEYFPHGNIEEIAIPEDVSINNNDEDEGPLVCYNDLPGSLKLKISLQMAEALADLHGYSGGVVVHQDVKLDQFFLNADKSGVVLNDFNRAEFMLWDECTENYCKYSEGYGMGNWRSPEEYYDEFLNEKVDVFSLGNNMYALLTGLMPFHDVHNYEEVKHLVRMGEKPYIDPRYKSRSLSEAKLVDIIEKCLEYYEEDRPSIFEVVHLLWQAVEVAHSAKEF